MRRLQRGRVFVGASKVWPIRWQGLAAVFLLGMIFVEVAVPPLSVYAAIVNTGLKSLSVQNYAGPLVTKNSALNTPQKTFVSGNGLQIPNAFTLPAPQAAEITKLRTANSVTMRNTDGTVTQRQYMQPINYQDGGSWQPIETGLVNDQNAADASSPPSQQVGRLSNPWASSADNFIVKANS